MGGGTPPSGGFGGGAPGGTTSGGTASGGTGTGGFVPGGSSGAAAGGPGGGGGMFGGDTSSLTSALTYIKANGGGTLVISSQSGASRSIIASGADVAAIGGFSGSETEVSADWLADAVESGKVRWILVSSSGMGGGRDGRVGATEVMGVAAQVGTAVGSVDGLYDLQGTADAIRAAG
jgi:hypothetical protein